MNDKVQIWYQLSELSLLSVTGRVGMFLDFDYVRHF